MIDSSGDLNAMAINSNRRVDARYIVASGSSGSSVIDMNVVIGNDAQVRDMSPVVGQLNPMATIFEPSLLTTSVKSVTEFTLNPNVNINTATASDPVSLVLCGLGVSVSLVQNHFQIVANKLNPLAPCFKPRSTWSHVQMKEIVNKLNPLAPCFEPFSMT